jgi:mycothiol synthase
VIARAAALDGVAAVSGHVLAAIDSGTADLLLVRSDSASTPDGLAVALGTDPAEVVVDPRSRGRGLGSALVGAALDRQGAVWAYGDLPAAAAVARRLDLDRGRVLLQMRRSLPADEVGQHLPVGVSIRTFVPGQDDEAFLGVNARAFAWHPEQGRLDLAGLNAEMQEDWFDPAGFFLAVRPDAATPSGDRVVGFHWTKTHPTDPTPGPDGRQGPIGEIYVLGVDPEAAVRGLGGPLTAVGLDYLANRGLNTVMLFVEGDNTRAIKLYERFGFGTFLTNVAYARRAPATR